MPYVIVWDGDVYDLEAAKREVQENARILARNASEVGENTARVWESLASAMANAEEVETPTIQDWMQAKMAAQPVRYEVRQNARPFEDLAAEFAKAQNEPIRVLDDLSGKQQKMVEEMVAASEHQPNQTRYEDGYCSIVVDWDEHCITWQLLDEENFDSTDVEDMWESMTQQAAENAKFERERKARQEAAAKRLRTDPRR